VHKDPPTVQSQHSLSLHTLSSDVADPIWLDGILISAAAAEQLGGARRRTAALEALGIRMAKGMEMLELSYERTDPNAAWPYDFTTDEIRNSLIMIGTHANLSMQGLRVLPSSRARCRILVPETTAEELLEFGTVDMIPGISSVDSTPVEYTVFEVDERGRRKSTVEARSAEKAARIQNASIRKEEREAEQASRRARLLSLYYTYPQDLLGADMESPIFTNINSKIEETAQTCFGQYPPEHINIFRLLSRWVLLGFPRCV
jgi:hypothetical protein